MKVLIDEEYAGLVPALSEAIYNDLKRSIKEKWIMATAIINPKGIILDGHHRFRACQELGIEPNWIVKTFDDDLHEKLFVIDSNLKRRHLNTFGRIELALTKKPILEEIAKQNSLLNLKQNKSDTPTDRNLTLGRVDEKIASDVHSSRDTVRKVEFLLEKADSEAIKSCAKTGQKSLRNT